MCSNIHLSVIFHAANLTAAIDIAMYCAVAHSDIRFVHHGFHTLECASITLASSEHIAMTVAANAHSTTRDGNIANTTAGWIYISIVCISCVCAYIAALTATIYVTFYRAVADGDIRRLNQSNIFLLSSRITTGCTEHISVAIAVNTHGATTNRNCSRTTAGNGTSIVCCTYRSHSSGTIYIVYYKSTVDIHSGIALHNTR